MTEEKHDTGEEPTAEAPTAEAPDDFLLPLWFIDMAESLEWIPDENEGELDEAE